MKVPKIILLNGPPRAGKDTIGAAILDACDHARRPACVMKFAGILKDAAHRLFTVGDVRHDHFETMKEQPAAELFGATPRKVYIQLSEGFFKPLFGKRFFGERLSDEIWMKQQDEPVEVVVVTDCGFEEEVRAVVDRLGADNCYLVRVIRDGCDFKGDSRDYVHLNGIAPVGHSFAIHNNGPINSVPALADYILAQMTNTEAPQ